MNWQKYVALEAGETLLWEGRPVAWRYALTYIPLTFFGGVWCAVAWAMWSDRVEPRTAGYWVVTTLVTFVAVFAVTAPLQAWVIARGTTYVLTNRRAIVVQPPFNKTRRVEIYPVSEWKLEMIRLRDGSGEIGFAQFGKARRLGFKYVAAFSVVEPLVRSLGGEAGPRDGR